MGQSKRPLILLALLRVTCPADLVLAARRGLRLGSISRYTIAAAMRTATPVPTIESKNGPLERDPVVDRMISDTELNTIITASTSRVKVRAPTLPVKSKKAGGNADIPRIA